MWCGAGWKRDAHTAADGMREARRRAQGAQPLRADAPSFRWLDDRFNLGSEATGNTCAQYLTGRPAQPSTTSATEH